MHMTSPTLISSSAEMHFAIVDTSMVQKCAALRIPKELNFLSDGLGRAGYADTLSYNITCNNFGPSNILTSGQLKVYLEHTIAVFQYVIKRP